MIHICACLLWLTATRIGGLEKLENEQYKSIEILLNWIIILLKVIYEKSSDSAKACWFNRNDEPRIS